jgi:glucose/arabinose dehydrogenase
MCLEENMSRLIALVDMFVWGVTALAADPLPKPILTGLKNPESVAIGSDGRMYVSEIGDPDKPGDGRVLVVDKEGKAIPYATGLDDPKGMVSWQKSLFVTDIRRVWRIDEKGKAEVFAAKEAFPSEPLFLNDLAVDENGILYVSDSGDSHGRGGAIYRIDHKGKVKLIADTRVIPSLHTPHGLVLDGVSHLLVVDFGSGELLRIRIADGSAVKIAEGFDGGDGLAWDWFGQLFITSWKHGKVWGIARPGQKPVLLASGFQSAADLCLDPTGRLLLVPDMKAGTVTAMPAIIPGNEVDASPLPIETVIAFPDLKWAGWDGFTAGGKVVEHRPIFLTHAGDGSQRNFVIVQQGFVHVFPNDPKASQTKIFLDIRKKVYYSDDENEQGLLGLAFHPNYKKNGEFFVFYSLREPRLTNVLSHFRVSKDDPDKADPNSEQELIRLRRPFWNHDGGTLCFGPDGYLYVVVGDGGAANDPYKNGQNLKTFFGKILRIDVDRPDGAKKYGIPKDNPFVATPNALPEIWAYGVRNPWRMAFDRKTGWLWAGDVGQNLFEEIDIIVKGGNYGWSVREGLHPFSNKGIGPREDLIEPIWEYHHDIGKSITGGLVYRGARLPELDGHYLYGDYVSSRIWALKYDAAKRRVVANRPLVSAKLPIFSFGEDERGEAYLLGPTVTGQGIFRFKEKETGQKGD